MPEIIATPGVRMDPLVERILDCHGGLDRWRRLSAVSLDFSSGGLAFRARMQGKALSRIRATIDPHRCRVSLADFPAPGTTGKFDRGVVGLHDASGICIATRTEPRAAFESLRHKLWWDSLDILYFAGYAIWNYLCFPYWLADPAIVRACESAVEDEGRIRLTVDFEPDFPTHCARQTFHYDASGLLVEHRYTAEPFGKWAKASHHCSDHRKFDGFVIPTCRRVRPRLAGGYVPRFPVLVWIDIHRAEFHPAS